MLKNSLIIICLFCFGCKTFSPEYLELVDQNKKLSNNVFPALIKSVEMEYEAEKSLLTEEEQKSIEKLISDLKILYKYDIVISDYVFSNADSEAVAKFLNLHITK